MGARGGGRGEAGGGGGERGRGLRAARALPPASVPRPGAPQHPRAAPPTPPLRAAPPPPGPPPPFLRPRSPAGHRQDTPRQVRAGGGSARAGQVRREGRPSSNPQDSSPPRLPPGLGAQVAPRGSGSWGRGARCRPRPGAGVARSAGARSAPGRAAPPGSSQSGPTPAWQGPVSISVAETAALVLWTRSRALRQVGQVGPGGECCRPRFPLGFGLRDSPTAKENHQP